MRAGSLLYTTFRLSPSTVHQVTPSPPPSALHTGIHDIPTRNSMILHDLLRAFVPLAPPHKRADRPQLHLRLEAAQIEPVTLNLPDQRGRINARVVGLLEHKHGIAMVRAAFLHMRRQVRHDFVRRRRAGADRLRLRRRDGDIRQQPVQMVPEPVFSDVGDVCGISDQPVTAEHSGGGKTHRGPPPPLCTAARPGGTARS